MHFNSWRNYSKLWFQSTQFTTLNHELYPRKLQKITEFAVYWKNSKPFFFIWLCAIQMLTWCMGAMRVLDNGCEEQEKKSWKMWCLRKMVNLDDAEFPYILRMALSCDWEHLFLRDWIWQQTLKGNSPLVLAFPQ